MDIYTPTELRSDLYRILESVQEKGKVVHIHSGKTSDYDAVIVSKTTWDHVQQQLVDK